MHYIFQKIRLILFWLFDFLNGSKIRKHYNDIKFINDSTNSLESTDRINERLKKILDHSVRTTIYYKDLKPDSSLSEFPVVNKNIIRERFNEFSSSRFSPNVLFSVVTSGSTGTPFKVLQDKGKKLRNSADTIYFGKKAGYIPGQRLYYLKIWNEINKKSDVQAWLQNIIPLNVFDLSDEAIENLIEKIKSDKSSKSFLGYASAYEAICRYLESNSLIQINAKVKAIIAMSEGLNDYTKNSMKRYFNAPVVSRYSNVENGMLAQQKIDGSPEFFINHASYKIEILNIDNDSPAPFGVPGRIVVTDYFNYGMPIIRYDTGDIGIIIEGKDEQKGLPMLAKIEGRRMDQVFNTAGKQVSSFTITNNMWKYSEIKQYQFIQQTAKEYEFKLNVNSNFSREVELINEFSEYFGKDSIIRVTYVDEIPLLASGKRKKVINNSL